MIKARPRPPKKWLDNWHSGNEYCRTKVAVEYCSGDVMKAIGDLCHQLSDYDGLQNAEILALVKCYLDEHITEEDC